MDSPAPSVVLKNLNDYNLELQVRAWIEDESKHIAERFALRELIFETLNDAGVEMPFETLEIHQKQLEPPAAA